MGKIKKVLLLDNDGDKVGEAESQQVPDDPFNATMYGRGLVAPPYSLEQLVFLAETHPTHNACLERKSSDVVGGGWEWEPLSDDADEVQKDQLEEWLEGLSGDEATLQELLNAAYLDFETTGQGYLEVAWKPDRTVGQLYHAPSHTIRWHKSGEKLAQERGGQYTWFRRWGSDDELMVNEKTGYRTSDETKVANDLLVFRKTSRRSSWYGIPTWVAAIGWVSLAIAARDYNILFFQNAREARWAVILSNIDDDPQLLDEIEQAFKVGLKDPHRNLVIPVIGDGNVEFQKLSQDGTDLSFDKLMGRCDDAILVAHEMPGDRIGLSKVGALGGSIAGVANEVYAEGVVATSQELVESRMNWFIDTEFAKAAGVEPQWKWKLKPIDLSEEELDLKAAVDGFQKAGWKLNEARKRVGLDPLPDEDARGEQFVWELAPGGAAMSAAAGDGSDGLFSEDELETRFRQQEEKLLDTLSLLLEE